MQQNNIVVVKFMIETNDYLSGNNNRNGSKSLVDNRFFLYKTINDSYYVIYEYPDLNNSVDMVCL